VCPALSGQSFALPQRLVPAPPTWGAHDHTHDDAVAHGTGHVNADAFPKAHGDRHYYRHGHRDSRNGNPNFNAGAGYI